MGQRAVKRGVRTFTLPGEEELLEEYLNDDLIEIMDEVITPCPKEGIILYLIKYEDYK